MRLSNFQFAFFDRSDPVAQCGGTFEFESFGTLDMDELTEAEDFSAGENEVTELETFEENE